MAPPTNFSRIPIFNARTFFVAAAGSPTPPVNYNYVGGNIGGPIRRNKLFFFGDYLSGHGP